MEMKELLNQLEVGSAVAEFDNELERYFVETPTFRALVEDKVDVIAGDKGTSKTALFKILSKRRTQFRELDKVEIVPGFNPIGNPVFQKLAQEPSPLREADYMSVWKAYIVSLVGNWLLSRYERAFTEHMPELDRLLTTTGTRSADAAAGTVFSKVLNTLHSIRSAQISFTGGISGQVEFADQTKSVDSVSVLSGEDGLRLLNQCLSEAELSVWVILDRLDEAFQGFTDTEVPALRALFRTYLDLLAFDRLRLKVFVRNDLFRKIIQGGFVNLTHINARKTEIIWEEEDLLNLLCQRIRRNDAFTKALNLVDADNETMFGRIFPVQVDVGKRKSGTWSWIMARIRDGNHVKPPRNLIDLISMARETQLRGEDREPRQVLDGAAIIEGESLRRALTRLSDTRVQDTLLAEAGAAAPLIERFREGKAEHNEGSLAKLFGLEAGQVKANIKLLIEIGFLEELTDSYKIPMLYRDGLNVTQGKAFARASVDDEDSDS
jgi:hypothetical protein